MVRPVADAFAAGDVLGGRYRLERLVGGEHAVVGTGLWRAEDLTLARPVAVRLLVGADAVTRQAFLDAAARASGYRDPRLAATYDADVVGTGRAQTAYLVREWVVGDPLRTLLTDGGLDPARLGPILRSAAEAVAALHAQAGWHGRLHPDNVLVADDRARVTDPGTGWALATAGLPDDDGSGQRSSAPPLPGRVVEDLGLGPLPAEPDAGDDPALLRRLQRYDTCDLARVAYAAGTGCWPGGRWRGLRGAPVDSSSGRPLAPRKVAAGVPREVDTIVVRTLLPASGQRAAIQTAAGVAAELTRVTTPPPEPTETVRATRRWRPPARLTWLVLALVGLVVVGVAGYSTGKHVGAVPGQNNTFPTYAPAPTASGTAGTPGTAIPLAAAGVSVTAFDPPPGDGSENDDQIPFAYDGSAATAWTTSTYGAPRLGNLKPGVGLLVDLGTARQVAEVDLVLQGTPTAVELRAADQPSTDLGGFPLVASDQNAQVTTKLVAGQSHRYWLVWLTSLPQVSGGYRGGIVEMTFLS